MFPRLFKILNRVNNKGKTSTKNFACDKLSLILSQCTSDPSSWSLQFDETGKPVWAVSDKIGHSWASRSSAVSHRGGVELRFSLDDIDIKGIKIKPYKDFLLDIFFGGFVLSFWLVFILIFLPLVVSAHCIFHAFFIVHRKIVWAN